SLPVVVLALVPNIQETVLDDWVFLVGMFVWMVVTIGWVVRMRKRPAPGTAAVPPAPSLADRLVINAGILGIVTPAMVFATGVTQALALSLGIVTYLVPLHRTPLPVVAAGTVATAPAAGPLGTVAFL